MSGGPHPERWGPPRVQGTAVVNAVDLDQLVTAAQAAAYFRTTREVIYMRIRRYKLEPADRQGPRGAPRYRLRALLGANAAAQINNTGGGRSRRPPTSEAA